MPFNDTKWLLGKRIGIEQSIRVKFRCFPCNSQQKSSKANGGQKAKKGYRKSNSKPISYSLSSVKANNNSKNVTKFINEKRLNIKFQENKLKHNKSCEGGISSKNQFFEENSNILFNSMNYENSKKRDFNSVNTSLGKIKNYNSAYKKSVQGQNGSSKTLTDIITNSNKQTIRTNTLHASTKSQSSELGFVKKLDEKFKTIEDSIIDKNFESGIDKDEIIVSSKKKLDDVCPNVKSTKFTNKTIEDDKDFFSDEPDEASDNESEFDSLKNDFEIFYTDDYVKSISSDMLKLELQLVIEKILELQQAYHKQITLLRKTNNQIRKKFKFYAMKYIDLSNKNAKLNHEKEKVHFLNTLFTFVDNHRLKQNNEMIEINRNECSLWKKIIVKRDKRMSDIFEKVFVDNPDNLLILDDVEKMIAVKLIKKLAKRSGIPVKNGANPKNVIKIEPTAHPSKPSKNNIHVHSSQTPSYRHSSLRHGKNEIKFKK